MSWQVTNNNQDKEDADWKREEYIFFFLHVSKINLSSDINYLL